ncbi:MAG: hypothetical protein QXV17_04725 [Candidatus Micrarchaeaceae archaeon]
MILSTFSYIVSEISGIAASIALSAIIAERAFFARSGRKARFSGGFALGMAALFAISLAVYLVI